MHKAPMQHPPASIFQPSSYGPPMSYGLPGTGAPPVTAAEEAGVGAGGEPVREQELPWGPEHPCYPHMNPHVPIASSEYFTTRIIRIRRDWMIRGDLAPTFSNLYPEILDPMLPEHEFRKVIAHLNATLIDVYSPTDLRNWLDGMLGFLTGWLWEDAGHTAIKRGLAELEEWIKAWNETTGVQQGVKIWPLRNTGYMSIDIQIPDPKVAVVPEGEVDSQPSFMPPPHSRQESLPRPMTTTTISTAEVR